MLPSPLRGIVTPLITPLHSSGAIDPEGLERLVEHVIGGGVNGLFVLGTTGEGPALSSRLRAEMVQRTCRIVRNRVSVLAGVTDTSFDDAVEMARSAAEAGADAVVTAGPLYFRVTQELLLRYFERFADQSPLPVFLYNMPSCTGVHIGAATVVKAAGRPNVAGMKDSSGDMTYFHQLLRGLKGRDGFTLMIGPEELTAEAVLYGAHGGVNGGSNLWPRLYSAIYAAAARGDLATVARLQPIVVEVCGRIFDSGSYGNHYLEGVKYAAHRMGICSPFAGMPYGGLSEAGKRELDRAVDEIGARVKAAVAER